MKLLLALCIVCCAMAAEVQIISQDSTVDHNGKYHYHYELGDGSKATQDGVLKHITEERDGEAIEGRFAFIGDDGQEYAVAYTADENGYRPVGAHLPTPPPTPESVLKTLKYLELHPYKPPKNKKQ